MGAIFNIIWLYSILWCPPDMARVGLSCIDLFEAPNQRGQKPLVMFSAYDAERWCESKGKRLCTRNEWEAGCEGTYDGPIKLNGSGIVDAPGKCNNDKYWISVDHDRLILGSKSVRKAESERLWQGELSGSRSNCVSSTGVYDTIGNVEEWVKSPDDRFGYALMGHYWSRGAKTCSSRVASHDPKFFYYSTGFRCCRGAYLGDPNASVDKDDEDSEQAD
jgi:sulfatase modifying factor 1